MRRRLFGFLAFFFIISFFFFNLWKGELNGGDAFGYYLHLPATFLYFKSDLSFEQPWAVARSYAKGLQKYEDARNGTPLTPLGRHMNKYPIGVAVLTLPFFIVGHISAVILPGYPADGFSMPYRFWMGFGTLIYVFWGLWLLFGVLERYISTSIAAITIGTLALGTNLFYFTIYNSYMAHPFVFAMFCWLLDRTVAFYDVPSYRRAAGVGLAMGLLALTRLHDIIFAVVPVFWGLFSSRGLWTWIKFWFQHIGHLLTAAAVGAVVLFPQALYYKLMSGQWYYYAYAGEKFNFEEPNIIPGLTSFSNGWFIYTPVMAFAIIGILFMRRKVLDALVPLLLVVPAHIFISYSWWCWNYVNGFGSRPMVDMYPLMAFPLAAFYAIWSRFTLKWLLNLLILGLFALLNVFQTWQNDEGIIWSEMENERHFLSSLGQWQRSKPLLATWDSDEWQYRDSVPLIRTLAVVDAQQEPYGAWANLLPKSDKKDPKATPTKLKVSVSSPDSSDRLAFNVTDADTTLLVLFRDAGKLDIRPRDLIYASVDAYFRQNEHKIDRMDVANLIVSFHANDGRELKRKRLRIASQIGNPTASMWSRGDGDQWGRAGYYVQAPDDFPPDGFVNVHIQNEHHERIWLDDLRIEHRRLPEKK
jgi:hypothetical protein